MSIIGVSNWNISYRVRLSLAAIGIDWTVKIVINEAWFQLFFIWMDSDYWCGSDGKWVRPKEVQSVCDNEGDSLNPSLDVDNSWNQSILPCLYSPKIAHNFVSLYCMWIYDSQIHPSFLIAPWQPTIPSNYRNPYPSSFLCYSLSRQPTILLARPHYCL